MDNKKNKAKAKQGNENAKKKILSIDDFKKKQEKIEKRIREFQHGPQPLSGCTCGHHTDPNEFLIEKQVTDHYLKDRKRYIKGLEGQDPLEDYMDVFKELMGPDPLVKLNRKTQSEWMNYISHYFNQGMDFYEKYIKNKEDLNYKADLQAKDLMDMYKVFKKYIVKSLINSYIIDKLDFIRENNKFAWTQNELINREDTLDTQLNETQGYINFMEEHFSGGDINLQAHVVSAGAKNLNKAINKLLDGDNISSEEVDLLGCQMEESLMEIKETIAYNRKRDIKVIKNQYEEVKNTCSLEYKAKMLIDIELRNRQIKEKVYRDKSEFTANNSVKELIKTIGMENLIKKLSTGELKILYQEFAELQI